ncbi:hypothetical protein NHX12_022578 [Muraenolepis orangiensis]|uniref:Uncharacterized protein n=1 Tax=Muraenolepis orangiensis TaxID=630683 RepID=A0A9Q0ERA1_9TELE|nr:hypothetical protein NHX12_022578 [Muraenolepis orangiensis]
MQWENSDDKRPQQDGCLRAQLPTSRETALSTAVALLSWPCSAKPPERHRHHQHHHHHHHPATPGPATVPTSFRSCSVPIIPSVQGHHHHHHEVSCMQTSPGLHSATAAAAALPRYGEAKARDSSLRCSPRPPAVIGRKQDEVALLLEEAQEHLRALALAHKKREDESLSNSCNGSTVVFVEAKETVCFLSLNGGAGSGVLSCKGPTETQVLSHNLSHRDLGHTGQ